MVRFLKYTVDANLNRHALRRNKNIGICCEPQSTCFETQQNYWNMMWTSTDTLWDPTKILEYLPKKAKIQIFNRILTQRL